MQVQQAHGRLLTRLKEQMFLTTPGLCIHIEAILQAAGLLCRCAYTAQIMPFVSWLRLILANMCGITLSICMDLVLANKRGCDTMMNRVSSDIVILSHSKNLVWITIRWIRSWFVVVHRRVLANSFGGPQATRAISRNASPAKDAAPAEGHLGAGSP